VAVAGEQVVRIAIGLAVGMAVVLVAALSLFWSVFRYVYFSVLSTSFHCQHFEFNYEVHELLRFLFRLVQV
jgi:hypothetical protein